MNNGMEVLIHDIYEYRMGVRHLALLTTERGNQECIEEKLKDYNIPYMIQPISDHTINIYFGHEKCIEVLNKINKANLKKLTAEEDFILGVMLGYDIIKQCERYLKRKNDS